MKKIYTGLRLFELLFHAAIPIIALHYFSRTGEISDGVVVLSLFFVLIIWYILFVFLHQFQYPSGMRPAVLFTALTIIQLSIIVANTSITFFAYVYYIQSLIVMTILLFFGALYIVSSEKKIKNQSWLALALFVFALGSGWYVLDIFFPIVEHIQGLTLLTAVGFITVSAAQIVKEIWTTAHYLKMKDIREPKYPLPNIVLVASMCIGIVASAIVISV